MYSNNSESPKRTASLDGKPFSFAALVLRSGRVKNDQDDTLNLNLARGGECAIRLRPCQMIGG
jgi:hypothetical protein